MFAVVSIVPDPPEALPAPVPDIERPDGDVVLAAVPEDHRIEITSAGGQMLVAIGGADFRLI
ncbi:hypothetical protein ACQKLX_21300 [Bosea sp. NPDC003192]|uniref:hypothetical protein n=1 Tax=Bosea sp. NPDC003192 TaxID=3390551 RepID=UPI003CFFA536